MNEAQVTIYYNLLVTSWIRIIEKQYSLSSRLRRFHGYIGWVGLLPSRYGRYLGFDFFVRVQKQRLFAFYLAYSLL